MSLRIDERKVKIFMASAGIDTIEELARRAEISPATMYNYFNGQSFRSSTVDKIAVILGCNSIDLISTNGTPPPHVVAQTVAIAA